MAPEWLLPALACAVASIFGALVWAQFVYRQKRHQLLWALGISSYAAASLIEAYVSVSPWNDALYRVYFTLAGGTVGLLGAGTLALVGNERVTRRASVLVAFAMLVALFAPWEIPLSGSTVDIGDVSVAFEDAGTHLGGKAIPFTNPGRIAFLLLNIAGGFALIGGALWSWRQHHRLGVLLIAVGAMLPFAGGSASTLAGLDARILLQAGGIFVMLIGYLAEERGRRTEVQGASV